MKRLNCSVLSETVSMPRLAKAPDLASSATAALEAWFSRCTRSAGVSLGAHSPYQDV